MCSRQFCVGIEGIDGCVDAWQRRDFSNRRVMPAFQPHWLAIGRAISRSLEVIGCARAYSESQSPGDWEFSASIADVKVSSYWVYSRARCWVKLKQPRALVLPAFEAFSFTVLSSSFLLLRILPNFAIERLLSNICSSFEALSASIPIGCSLFHNQ